MGDIPRVKGFDSTIPLLRDGYRAIGRRCRALGSDVFQTRIMLRRAVCVTGEDAARMFYRPDRFTRTGAMPPTALLSLQDEGSVQTLDGAAHHHRKQMFLRLMEPDAVRRIGDEMEAQWRGRVPQWQARKQVALLPELSAILCRTVCSWAGVPLTERVAERRTVEFAAMIDGAGAVGPRNWRGLLLRSRTERWARRLIQDVRSGRLAPPNDSALKVIAGYRDPRGALLSMPVAAVELINILRPTVAVANFIVFVALALHRYPEWRARVTRNPQAATVFAEEVRRLYPFFPAVGGRALVPFEWRGHNFQPGSWVLLDLYGTNHDARIWDEPYSFQPERFLNSIPSRYAFVPQGGGDHATTHRCPGEWITVELMTRAAQLLAGAMRYEVPKQDLRVDLRRLPAQPRSGFVIRNVRPARPSD